MERKKGKGAGESARHIACNGNIKLEPSRRGCACTTVILNTAALQLTVTDKINDISCGDVFFISQTDQNLHKKFNVCSQISNLRNWFRNTFIAPPTVRILQPLLHIRTVKGTKQHYGYLCSENNGYR